MTDITKVTVADGKYTVIHENGSKLHALRYGEAWRDLSGDGLVLALVQEIEELRAAIEADRKRRGEPVTIPETVASDNPEPVAWQNRYKPGEIYADDDLELVWKCAAYFRPLFSSPPSTDVVDAASVRRFSEWLNSNRNADVSSVFHEIVAWYTKSSQSAEPVGERLETTSEHIARDIREGRFPDKSERQTVPDEPVKVPRKGESK